MMMSRLVLDARTGTAMQQKIPLSSRLPILLSSRGGGASKRSIPRVSSHGNSWVPAKLIQFLPSVAANTSSPGASALRLARPKAAAATATSMVGHPRPSAVAAALPSSRTTNFDRNSVLQMLCARTCWNHVVRTSGSSQRSVNATTLRVTSGNAREIVNSVEEGTRNQAGNTEEDRDSSSSEARKSSSVDENEDERESGEEEEIIPAEDAKFLTSIRTRFNFIRVLEIAKTSNHPLAGARVLLLDEFGNVHSLYHEYRLLTNSYYDVFPSLPVIIPDGPVAIFGLAAGTAARIIHNFWPDLDMYGWELDPAVVHVARKYFNLQELEWTEEGIEAVDCCPPSKKREGFIGPGNYRKWKKANYSVFMENADAHRPRGRLRVMVGDVLSPEVAVEGGFAGIVVDVFADGAVIPALQEPGVWREMKKKLRPGGRIMVNCGGSCVDAGEGKKDGRVTMEETVAAMAREFPRELSILPLRCRGDNHIALTGPLPDLEAWSQALPECLRIGCENWVTFESRQRSKSS